MVHYLFCSVDVYVLNIIKIYQVYKKMHLIYFDDIFLF